MIAASGGAIERMIRRSADQSYPSSVLSAIVLWIAVGLLAWVYLGCPATVSILARLWPWRARPTDPAPTVTGAERSNDSL